MNIVLIHPYINVREKNIFLSEPLGLVYLATYLKHRFHGEVDVHILDLYALGANNPVLKGDIYAKGISDEGAIAEELKKLQPDIIGLTCCFTGYFEEALDVARIGKKYFPKARCVFGGAHATFDYENILKNNPFVDFVVRHEGELTFAELVEALQRGLSVDNIEGLSYRAEGGEVVANPPRGLIEDLGTLPIPDRSFIDMEFYKHSNSENFQFSRKTPIATLQTSRGCPYECVFCCTKNMWKRKWRPIPLEKVFEEIDSLVSKFGIREVVILDDQFILNKQRIYDFCDHFIEKKSDLAFSNIAGLSTWLADDDVLLAKMRKAGFYKLTLPVESVNPETIKFIRKNVDLDRVERLVKKANRLGYWTGAFFIIGFPYETREQIMETISYAYKSDLDFAHFFVAQPYIATELYTICEKEGLLGEEVHGTYIYRGWQNTVHMKADELNQIAGRASRGWMLHKIIYYLKNLDCSIQKIRRLDDFKYAVTVFSRLFRDRLKALFSA
jgi:magnesium-protoporphyrin IX monomethyl ester (oxidative) cyclase